jgi:hypothetical protein
MGSAFCFRLFFRIEQAVSFHDIQVFQERVMMENGETAVVLTTAALKTTIIRRLSILSIHGPIERF